MSEKQVLQAIASYAFKYMNLATYSYLGKSTNVTNFVRVLVLRKMMRVVVTSLQVLPIQLEHKTRLRGAYKYD